jgi:hypothetical protein
MDVVDDRSMGSRAQIEFCIDAFVEETGYVPKSARPVRNPADLSPRLERWVGGLRTSAWRAWEDSGRSWFIQGRLIHAGVRPDAPTAHPIFRDHRARAITAGVWCRSAPARWDLVQALCAAAEAATA